jgi:hypothetical protein
MRAFSYFCVLLLVLMAGPVQARPAPDSFADLTAKLLPTVVQITTSRRWGLALLSIRRDLSSPTIM